MTMNLSEVRRAIVGSEGKIFRVEFIKRGKGPNDPEAGTIRSMVCRIGVSKGVTGEGLKFDPIAKGLITVWDVQKNGYRMINLDAVVNIKLAGQEYEIKEYMEVAK